MSLLGSIGGAIARTAGGFLAGGPAGAVAGFAGGFLGSGGSRPPGSPAPLSIGGLGDILNRASPFSIPIPSWAGQNPPQTTNGQCPRGYHLNKHALAASKKHGAVAARSMCVRNRSINPLNPRAVSRSLKRLKRARKLVTKLHAFGASRSTAIARRGGHRAGCGCAVCRRR